MAAGCEPLLLNTLYPTEEATEAPQADSGHVVGTRPACCLVKGGGVVHQRLEIPHVWAMLLSTPIAAEVGTLPLVMAAVSFASTYLRIKASSQCFNPP